MNARFADRFQTEKRNVELGMFVEKVIKLFMDSVIPKFQKLCRAVLVRIEAKDGDLAL